MGLILSHFVSESVIIVTIKSLDFVIQALKELYRNCLKLDDFFCNNKSKFVNFEFFVILKNIWKTEKILDQEDVSLYSMLVFMIFIHLITSIYSAIL